MYHDPVPGCNAKTRELSCNVLHRLHRQTTRCSSGKYSSSYKSGITHRTLVRSIMIMSEQIARFFTSAGSTRLPLRNFFKAIFSSECVTFLFSFVAKSLISTLKFRQYSWLAGKYSRSCSLVSLAICFSFISIF